MTGKADIIKLGMGLLACRAVSKAKEIRNRVHIIMNGNSDFVEVAKTCMIKIPIYCFVTLVCDFGIAINTFGGKARTKQWR